MLRDISTFGCLPAGLAIFLGGIVAAWFGDEDSGLESVFALACLGWFVFLGLPLLLGYLLARVERNRYRNPLRNALVGGFIIGNVSALFMALVVIPILPILSLGIIQALFLWFAAGAVLSAISAGSVTTYYHGKRFAIQRRNKAVLSE